MKLRKSAVITLTLVVLLIIGLTITWAAMHSREGTADRGMMGGPGMMGGQGGMGMGMGQMGCPMSGMMGRATVVTSGDFIYVMVGNTLQRYDRSLKLMNETEIKPNYTAMQQMMQNCPMMRGGGMGMGGGSMAPPSETPRQ